MNSQNSFKQKLVFLIGISNQKHQNWVFISTFVCIHSLLRWLEWCVFGMCFSAEAATGFWRNQSLAVTRLLFSLSS